MLAAYTGCEDYDVTPRYSATYKKQKDILINEEMIKEDISVSYEYRITEKGRFWLEYVLNFPFPTQKWEIPK